MTRHAAKEGMEKRNRTAVRGSDSEKIAEKREGDWKDEGGKKLQRDVRTESQRQDDRGKF